ncbi:MAG TPA: hypothetical protein VL737_02120 [Candidatus Pristimantibacillus sp.]|nr:hypothetical protein [Candidatus Pristimantibacillus sp.]
MDARKTYFVLWGVIALAFVALGVGTYIGTGILKTKSLDVKTARLQSRVVEENQTLLRKAKADIQKYNDLATVAKSIVPQDKDEAQTVHEITNLSSQNGIALGSITFPSSALGDNKTPNTQLVPVKSIPGVYSLQITVTSDAKNSVPFNNFINLLSALEHNRRTALVTGIALQPDSKVPGNLFFSLTLEEYIKP